MRNQPQNAELAWEDSFRVQEQQDNDHSAQLEVQRQRLNRIADRSAYVIVVDSVMTMRMLVASTLRELGFKNILRSANGSEALRAISRHNCDLAIIDWDLPRMNGFQLLEALRDDPESNDIIAIMLTAEAMQKNVIRAIEEQVDGYMTKPVRLDALARRVQEILIKRKVTIEVDTMLLGGNHEAAISLIQGLINTNPKRVWPHALLAKVYFLQGSFDLAVQIYEQMLVSNPEAVFVLLRLGQIEEMQGHHQEALDLYQQAIDKNPMFVKSLDAIARVHVQRDDKDMAMQTLKLATEGYGSENYSRHKVLADIALSVGDYTQAIKSFRKVIFLKPDKNMADISSSIGHCLIEEGEYNDAIVELRKSLKGINPYDSSMSHLKFSSSLLLGKAYIKKNDAASAVKLFGNMQNTGYWPDKKPPLPNYKINKEIGRVWLEGNEDKKAIDHLKLSIEAGLDDNDNISSIVAICEKENRSDIGKAMTNHASKIHALITNIVLSARKYAEKGDVESAEDHYGQALKVDSYLPRVHYNLAMLLFKQKKDDSGWRAILKALELAIQNWDFRVIAEICKLYISAGKFIDAERALAIALGLSDNDKELMKINDGIAAAKSNRRKPAHA